MLEMETKMVTRNMLLKYSIDCFLIMLTVNHSMNNEWDLKNYKYK